MKRIIFVFICLIVSVSLSAEKNPYYVYGVDFSKVKVYCASESPEKFVQAFKDINILLISENEKYNFSHILNNKVELKIDPMLKKLSNCDYSDLITFDSEYGEINCAEIIKDYNLSQKEGVGVVLIAKLLNKPLERAIYDFVIFDISTRNILYIKELAGEASGFGLRNYWAGSIYDILRHEKRIKIE